MQYLAEKIGQMMLVGFDGLRPPAYLLDWLAAGRVGGVYLFARNVASPAQVAQLVAECRAAAVGDILVGIDQEGGIVARLREGFSESPGAMALGAARDPDLAEAVAFMLGREMAALGINWTFAPVADIAHQPDNPSVSTRSVGRDKRLVAEIVAAQIRGFQRAGVAATVKHFPGLGNTIVDTHAALAKVRGPLRYLYEEDIYPFRRALQSDVACVMITHVLFEALDSDYPATLSPRVVSALLRDELGFQGAVCTDCMEMNAITDAFGAGESAVLTVLAGVDLPLFSHSRSRQEEAFEAVLAAVQSGRIPAERIDAALRRIQKLKCDFPLRSAPPIEIVGCAQHQALTERAARAGTVLVKRGERFPVRPGAENGRIVAIEFALQSISDAVAADAASPFAQYLKRRLPEARHELLSPSATNEEIPGAVDEALHEAETIILLARNAHLNAGQLELARYIVAGAQNVILVCARNPYDAGALADADSIICTNGDSRPSLAAAVDAIVGEYIPAGELTVSIT